MPPPIISICVFDCGGASGGAIGGGDALETRRDSYCGCLGIREVLTLDGAGTLGWEAVETAGRQAAQ
jgi:hypothetical protein